jgi:hypothetical protein
VKNQRPAKKKQRRARPQPQQGHAPPNGQVDMTTAPNLYNLETPHREQGDKPKSAQDTDARQSNQGATTPYRRIDKLNIALTLLFSFVVAVFTVFSTYYSSKQWEGIKQSLADAKETREIENRAWVNAESAELMKPIELPPNSRFSLFLNVTVKNTGASVATDGIAFFHVLPNWTPILSRDWNKPCETVDTQRAANEASDSSPWPVGFVLVPGQATKMPIGTSSDDITPEKAREGGFYVLGCITYKDQFNVMRQTRFCFRPASAIRDPSNVAFEVCNAFQGAS